MLADKTECISRSELEILQLERLKKIVAWAYERSAFYRRTFQNCGVTPDEIQTLADVRRLPFVTTEELHTVDALEFLTLPLSSIVRINRHNAGQLTNFYTKGDIRANVEMMIRALMAIDVLRGSSVGVQGDFADSRFLDVIYALESIGATVIPLGTNCRRWLDMTELFSFDTLISTPQLVMQLIIHLQAAGKEIRDCPITKILCLNTTNIFNTLQRHISERTSAKVFSLFAPPEVGHAGIMYQCADAAGHHVQEDFFLIELLRFGGDEPVTEPDHMGELVITALTAQAFPLIRWRTGQAVRRMGETCTCGREFFRVGTPYTRVEKNFLKFSLRRY